MLSLASRPMLRPLALVAAFAVVAALAFAVAADRASAKQVVCSSTFRVLHDDTIGKLKLSKGKYQVKVKNDKRLSCGTAFDLFRQFLQDYDGKLPDGWRVRAKRQEFFQPKTGDAFSVKRVKNGGGGGGGGQSPTGKACPNLFTVLHNDQIGKLKLKQGQYRLTLIAAGRLNCDRAAKLFRKFLQDYDGKLQNKWQLDVQTATFSKNRLTGFRVKRVSK